MKIRKHKIGEIKIGICKHTKVKIKQIFDGASNDNPNEFGWLCLHDD